MHYWLQSNTPMGRIAVSIQDNIFRIEEAKSDFRIWIDPKLVDLSAPIIVQQQETILFQGMVSPDLSTMAKSLLLRNDPNLIYVASIDVDIIP